MRSEYHLIGGRKNPYAERLGAKGRAELLRWWTDATGNLRVLPDDVAREFPDTKSTVDALRLVIKLRALRSTRGTADTEGAARTRSAGVARPRAKRLPTARSAKR
jgi:hypothetical protein